MDNKRPIPKSSDCYWCGKPHHMYIVRGDIGYCSDKCRDEGTEHIRKGRDGTIEHLSKD